MRLLLVLLALVAFALREHVVLATIVDHPIRGDIREYVAYAYNLVEHGVFGRAFPPTPPVPDDFRMPGFPWLIAAAMQVFPRDWYACMLQVQVVFGTATAVLVALLARQWLSVALSIIAGLLLALWPHHVAATGALQTEVVFGFFLVASLYAFTRAWLGGRIAWWIGAGVCFACAYLVNPVVLLFPLFVAVLAWWHGRKRPALAMLAVFFVPVIAMGVRSAGLPQADDASQGRAAMNFVQGSWPDYHQAARLYRSGDPIAVDITQRIDGETRALENDRRAGLALIGARMAHNPPLYVKWYASKTAQLWGWRLAFGGSPINLLQVRNSPLERSVALRAIVATYRTLNPVMTALLLIAAPVLLIAGLRRGANVPAAVAGALVVYLTFLHTVLQAEPRYAIAYRGIEAIVLVTALAWVAALLRKRPYREAPNSAGQITD